MRFLVWIRFCKLFRTESAIVKVNPGGKSCFGKGYSDMEEEYASFKTEVEQIKIHKALAERLFDEKGGVRPEILEALAPEIYHHNVYCTYDVEDSVYIHIALQLDIVILKFGEAVTSGIIDNLRKEIPNHDFFIQIFEYSKFAGCGLLNAHVASLFGIKSPDWSALIDDIVERTKKDYVIVYKRVFMADAYDIVKLLESRYEIFHNVVRRVRLLHSEANQ